MTQPRRRRLLDWKAALGIAISVALLYWVFRKQDLHALARAVRAADPLYFGLATAVATGVFWIRAWRWKSLLESVKPDIPFRSRFAATMIGFMGNNIFPARAGEFMRAYALTHEENIPIGASVASLAIERLLDGLTILAMLIIALFTVEVPQTSAAAFIVHKLHIFAIGVAIVFAVILFFVFAPARAIAITERMIGIFPVRAREPIMNAARAFIKGTDGLRSGHILFRAVSWSIALWLLNALGFWLAFRAFNLNLSFMQAIFFQCALVVGVAPPGAPGFWGAYEFAAKLMLVGLWQFDATTANAFAISYHLAGYIPVTLIGMYYAWRLGVSRDAAAAVEEEVVTHDDDGTTHHPHVHSIHT